MQKTGRILRRAAGIFGVLAALLALLAVLLPKIINTDSVKAAIESAVAKELGGTATYERLGLALIPRPQIEIRSLKIEVPGTASVSVAAARVQIRLLPLLRGRFAISSATLDRPALVFTLPRPAAEGGKPSPPEAQPAKLSLGKVLTVSSRAVPDLSLKISRGSLSVVREGQAALSLGELEAQLAFVPGQQEGQPPAGSSDVRFHITGEARAVIGQNKSLPGPLRISTGRFDALPESLAIAGARAQLLDMDVTLDGSIGDYLSAGPRADLAASGSIGPAAAAWLGTLAGLPDDLKLRAPLKVADVRLRTSGTGPASSRELAGNVAVKDGLTIPFELRQEPGRLSLKRLQVKDGASDALLTGAAGEKDFDLALAGSLEGSTLLRIFDRERMPFGSIKGDIRVRAPRGRWGEATAQGALEGRKIVLPTRLAGALVVDRFSVRADGRTLGLRPVVLSLGQDTLTVEGTASMSGKGLALDLDVSADRIGVAALLALAGGAKSAGGSTPKPDPAKALNVYGALRLRAASVALNGHAAEAVAITVRIGGGRTTADLERATVCGISLAGKLRADDREIEITLQPQARGRRLDEDARCLFPGELQLTGSYDLSGSLNARGPLDTLLRSLQGSFDISAKKGQIRHAKVAEGVIAYLEKTSVLKDSQAAQLRVGVPYDAIALRGTLRDGVLNLAKVEIRSKVIQAAAEGVVDLRARTLALTVLVAPLTGIDRVLSKIPIVKNIAANALIVVPVRVEGPFGKPEVKHLPASGIGTSIANLMKNIVQAPVKIIEPIVPAGGRKTPE